MSTLHRRVMSAASLAAQTCPPSLARRIRRRAAVLVSVTSLAVLTMCLHARVSPWPALVLLPLVGLASLSLISGRRAEQVCAGAFAVAVATVIVMHLAFTDVTGAPALAMLATLIAGTINLIPPARRRPILIALARPGTPPS